MSAYANDPRVKWVSDRMAVTANGGTVEGSGNEWASHDPRADGLPYQFHGSADEAIRYLIGDPR